MIIYKIDKDCNHKRYNLEYEKYKNDQHDVNEKGGNIQTHFQKLQESNMISKHAQFYSIFYILKKGRLIFNCLDYKI